MTGIGNIGGNQAIIPQQPVGGNDQAQGTEGKGIGNKIASFFKAVGSAIAAPFKALGNMIANIGNNAAQGGQQARQVQQPTWSNEQKAQKMEEFRQSPLFQAAQSGTTSGLNEKAVISTAQSLLETPEAVAAMERHGVSLAEAVSISTYTSQAFYDINSQIRSGKESPEVTQMREAFMSGLDKLPSFEGTVYRGSHLPKEVGLAHQEGETITATGIYSTTQSKDEVFRNINYHITIDVKEGSRGKDIAMFSDKPTEKEIAFPPGARFEVTSRVMEGREECSEMHPPSMGNLPSAVVTLIMKEV